MRRDYGWAGRRGPEQQSACTQSKHVVANVLVGTSGSRSVQEEPSRCVSCWRERMRANRSVMTIGNGERMEGQQRHDKKRGMGGVLQHVAQMMSTEEEWECSCACVPTHRVTSVASSPTVTFEYALVAARSVFCDGGEWKRRWHRSAGSESRLRGVCMREGERNETKRHTTRLAAFRCKELMKACCFE